LNPLGERNLEESEEEVVPDMIQGMDPGVGVLASSGDRLHGAKKTVNYINSKKKKRTATVLRKRKGFYSSSAIETAARFLCAMLFVVLSAGQQQEQQQQQQQQQRQNAQRSRSHSSTAPKCFGMDHQRLRQNNYNNTNTSDTTKY
jgi:hypothetical protein